MSKWYYTNQLRFENCASDAIPLRDGIASTEP
jgi:hypothetical protein